MSDHDYRDVTITVVHVHPDGYRKVRRIKYTCDMGCYLSGNVRRLSLGIMSPWRGAYPVRIDCRGKGGYFNPFSPGMIDRISYVGVSCENETYVVIYDYVKPGYSFYAHSPVVRSRRGGETGFPIQYGGVVPYIGSCNRPSNESPRPVGYCSDCERYHGFGMAIPFGGSTPCVGIAMDYVVYPDLSRWICGVDVDIKTQSKVLIGEMKRYGWPVSISKRRIVDYKDGKPVYENYAICGPGLSFSEVFADIMVQPYVLEPGPYVQEYGYVKIRTFAPDGSYVEGIRIMFVGYRTNGGMYMSASPCSAMFVAGSQCLVWAYAKFGAVWYCGSGAVTVVARESRECDVYLTESVENDYDLYIVSEARADDGTEGYVKIHGLPTELTYMGYSVGGEFGMMGVVALNSVVTGSLQRARGAIGTMLSVIELTLGSGGVKGITKIPATVKMSGFLRREIEVVEGRIVERYVEDARYGKYMVKTARGWIDVEVAVEEIQKKIERDPLRKAALFVFKYIKGGWQHEGGPISKGNGINYGVAVFEFLNEIEPEVKEEEKKEEEEESIPPPKIPKIPKPTPDSIPDPDPDPGPVLPVLVDPCYFTITPAYFDDNEVSPPPVVPVDPPVPGPIPPPEEEDEYVTYSFKSQGGIISVGGSKYLEGLYHIPGSAYGKRDSVGTIRYDLKSIVRENVSVTANDPIGLLAYDPVTGVGVSTGDATIDRVNREITFTFGSIKPNAVIVLLGKWGNSVPIYDPDMYGNFYIRVVTDENNKSPIVVKIGESIKYGEYTFWTLLFGTYECVVSCDGYKTKMVFVDSIAGTTPTYVVTLESLNPDTSQRIYIDIIAWGGITPNMRGYEGVEVNVSCVQMGIDTVLKFDRFGHVTYTVEISHYSVFKFIVDYTVGGMRIFGGTVKAFERIPGVNRYAVYVKVSCMPVVSDLFNG